MKEKNILVTGGCGFIGSHIAEHLCESNHVIVVDNLSAGSLENINGFRDKIAFLKSDLNDLPKLNLKDIEIVFHTAASVSTEKSIKDPLSDAQTNILGILSVLEICRKKDIERFVFSSSCAVYGDPKYLPVDEKHPLNPKSPYAISKKTGEEYCKIYNDLYGLKTVSLRYFNVFGPRQKASDPYSGVIPIFLNKIKNQERLPVYGDGNQTRDFIHVQDVVRANILASESKEAIGNAINIGTGRETSINQLLKIFRDVSEKELSVEYKPPRKGDIRKSVADISLARKTLKFEPLITLKEGLMGLWNK
ncbi:MAG: NAD-dependent epimerase/dehydratase family protein [Candidatus Hydrothermarchaeota archaeon]